MKKGELTSSQIITLVLAIAGFIIVLVFLGLLEIHKQGGDEACKLSILERAGVKESLQGFIPLQCTTKKTCITEGENCEQYIGEKTDNKEVLRGTDKEKAEKIGEITANALYDCWSMTGEGKLDIFGDNQNPGIWDTIEGALNLNKKDSVCMICERISLQNVSESILEKVDINDYLQEKPAPDGSGKTYLQRFTDDQIRNYPQQFRENFTDARGNTLQGKPTDQIAIIFMQIITEEDPWKTAVKTGSKTGAFIFAGTQGLGPLGNILTIKASALTALIGAAGAGTGAFIQTYRSRQVSLGYCDKFIEKEGEAKRGCSIITAIDYNNIERINNFCSRIDGNP